MVISRKYTTSLLLKKELWISKKYLDEAKTLDLSVNQVNVFENSDLLKKSFSTTNSY